MRTTTTITARSYIQLNHFNDTIYGVYNTKAGGSIGDFYNNSKYPIEYAMDGSLATKCFNNKRNSAGVSGIDNGFVVIPIARRPSIACALHFSPAADAPDRDPITVTLEGSNETDTIQRQSNSTWTLIYNGATGIDVLDTVPRVAAHALRQEFTNRLAFISYRLLVTTIRNISSNAVQYSEARILGCV